jgi:hypothetical protein
VKSDVAPPRLVEGQGGAGGAGEGLPPRSNGRVPIDVAQGRGDPEVFLDERECGQIGRPLAPARRLERGGHRQPVGVAVVHRGPGPLELPGTFGPEPRDLAELYVLLLGFTL